MIISQLNGGLGNQMFQYALGRVLSLKHQADLYYDTSPYVNQPPSNTKRQYELCVFRLPGKIATVSTLDRFGRPNRYKVFLNQYFHLGLNPYPKNYICERSNGFHPEILYLPDDVYLSGYWQTEKYFIANRTDILKDFSGRTGPISAKNKNLTKKIRSAQAISVHVRRGDFISNPNANAFHGVCSWDYYQTAMKLIEKQVKTPSYFIFSDDPIWTKHHIKSKHPVTYITHNHGKDSHEDIRLMASCQHNIIANSSFSWWGAWLNINPEKIVITPAKWFKFKTAIYSDIIPDSWINI